jgi:hypothetical protein
LQWASGELYAKEKSNPLYEYLENGKSTRFWDLFMQLSPASEPEAKRNWTIAKDNLWDNSMGWEWIFLFKL